MQYIRIVSFLTVLFLIASCSKEEEPILNIRIETVLDIPGGRNAFITHVFVLRNIATHIGSVLPAANKAQVKEVFATKGLLRGRFTSLDLSIIEDITIVALSRTTDNLSKEIFYRERVPINEKDNIVLFSSLSNVKDILLDEKIDLEVSIRFKAITTFPIEAELLLDFEGH